MRYFMLALVVCTVVVVGATLVGRAVDQQVRDRIVFTRDGVTLDCWRHVTGTEVSYDDCNQVP